MADEKRNDEPFEEIPTTKRGIYKYDEESGRWVLHRRADGGLHPLDLAEERPDPILGEVGQGLDVLPGQDERVPREQRPVIEERHEIMVL